VIRQKLASAAYRAMDQDFDVSVDTGLLSAIISHLGSARDERMARQAA